MKSKLPLSQERALAAIKAAGAVKLTAEDSDRIWAPYLALTEQGLVTWYLGPERGSRVFMLRPAFKERGKA